MDQNSDWIIFHISESIEGRTGKLFDIIEHCDCNLHEQKYELHSKNLLSSQHIFFV